MTVNSTGWAAALRFGALLAVLSSPGLARADEFRRHYDQGMKRYESRDFEGALREFRAAYERRALPRLLINIGRTLFRMGKPREALAFYEQYLRAEPNPPPSVRTDVEGYMAQARALVEVPAIPAPDAPALPPAPAPVKPAPDPTAARPVSPPTGPRSDVRPAEASAPTSVPVAAAVPRAPVASARASGGRTLLAVGVPVGVVGLGLLGLGGASLALDGGCADTFCQNLYAGRTAGIAELAVGGVLLSVGVGLSVAGARRRGHVAPAASSQGEP